MKKGTLIFIVIAVLFSWTLMVLPAFAITPPSDEEAAQLKNDPDLHAKIDRVTSLLAPLLDDTLIRPVDVGVQFSTDLEDRYGLTYTDDGYYPRYDVNMDDVIDERDFVDLAFVAPPLVRQAARSPRDGEARCIVLPIKFPDVAPDPGHDSDYWDNMFFGEATYTTRSYFDHVSQNRLAMGGDVLVNPDETDGYWMADFPKTAYNFDMALLDETLTKADAIYDFNDYDADTNGEADGVFFIYAGDTDGWGDFYWGWATYGNWVIDGVRVGPLMFVGEHLMTYRVAAHEYGHMMGLPDYYDYTFQSNGIGAWGLMGKGISTFCAKARTQIGWAEPIAISMDTYGVEFTPRSVNGDVYRLWHMGEFGPEYFLLEMVDQQYYDYKQPGDGLMIWHIDDTVGNNNNENHKHNDVEEADGLDDLDTKANNGDATDPYWLGNQDTFDGDTYPNTNSYSSGPTSVQVVNISAVSAGMITADLIVGIPGDLETDETEPNNFWNDSGVITIPDPNGIPDGKVDIYTDPSDYWRFTVGKPSIVDVTLNSHNDGINLSLYVWALGGGGPVEMIDSTWADEHIRAYVDAPGNHFIEVRAEQGAAYYDLSVNIEILPDAGLIEIESIPMLPETIYDNTQTIPAMRLDIKNNAGWPDLESLKFYTHGTFPSLIEKIELWLDDGDEIFGPGLDTLIREIPVDDSFNKIEVNNIGLNCSGYTVIWVVADIEDTGGTGGEVGLSILSYKDIVFSHGEVIYDNFPQESGLATAIPAPTPLSYVAAGDFMMGSDPLNDPYYEAGCDFNEETPHHKNRTGDYYIARYEVTCAEYAQFMADGGYATQIYWNPGGGWNWKNNNEVTAPGYWNDPEQQIGDAFPDYPVGGCSWYESMAYATYLGGRLPTEQEWEKAGRGTDAQIFTYGDVYDVSAYSAYGPLPIGSYPQSDSMYGVADMSGNIFEWVHTSWAWGMYQSYANGSYEQPSNYHYKMHRGYRFLVVGSCDMDYATRLSYRDTWPRTYRWTVNGFRVAYDPPT